MNKAIYGSGTVAGQELHLRDWPTGRLAINDPVAPGNLQEVQNWRNEEIMQLSIMAKTQSQEN